MNSDKQESFYQVLPEESQGRVADNSHTFRVWADEKNPNRHKLPFIGLFRDQMKGTLTWHAFDCEDSALDAIDNKPEDLNELASRTRFRALQAVEIFRRRDIGVEHFMVDKSQPS